MLTDEEAEKSKQRIYESERAKQADGAKLMDSSPLSSLSTIHRLLLAGHHAALKLVVAAGFTRKRIVSLLLQ